MNTNQETDENSGGTVRQATTVQQRVQAFTHRGRYEAIFQNIDGSYIRGTLREYQGVYTVRARGRDSEVRNINNQLYVRIGRNGRRDLWSRVELRTRILTTIGVATINVRTPNIRIN